MRGSRAPVRPRLRSGVGESVPMGLCTAPQPPRVPLLRACGDPWGWPLSQEEPWGRGGCWPRPGRRYCLCPAPSEARLSGPAASGESSVNPDTDGKKPGLSPRSSLLLTVPSREEPRTAPLQPGPLGLPCPPRPSPRVPQPLHGMSVLALGSSSCPGFLQLMAWACGQPKISALGGGSSPEIPPHDLLAFDLQPGRLDPVFSAWMSRN